MHGHGNTAWERIRKIITNPTVEVIALLAIVALSAWIVIETESLQRRSALPMLFGHK